MECCICKKEIDKVTDGNGRIIYDQGHNADPVENGRCCSRCNYEIVLPARLKWDPDYGT